MALCIYKSKEPNETIALERALEIIKKLNPQKSLDTETLGITGAIYKRLYKLNNNFDYLDEAILYYKKGYIIQNDYYNGENLATCLLFKTRQSNLKNEEVGYLKFESKVICKNIIKIIESRLESEEANYWMYATLSICYLCLGDDANAGRYQSDFISNCEAEWEKKTFFDTIKGLKCLV